MLFNPALESPLEGVGDRIHQARTLTPALIREVVADVCSRLPTMKKAGKSSAIDRLIEAGAWCDVAFALLNIELPSWTVRRLVYDDGEWFCSLSQTPNLPLDLDDTAEAHHSSLPMAIIGALIEARKRTLPAPAAALPHSHAHPVCAMSCDNFG